MSVITNPTAASGGTTIGGAVVGGTPGSVLFIGAGSVLAQDNAKFFWDDTNFILKIGGELDFQTTSGNFKSLYIVPNAAGNNWFEGNAGNTTVTGSENFGTGDTCLGFVSTGSRNTGVGSGSLFALTTGSDNFGFGTNACRSVGSGTANVGIGSASLQSNQIAAGNVGIGGSALNAVGAGGTAENYNIGIGNLALATLRTGIGNVGVGAFSADSMVDGTRGVFIGYNVFASATGSNNNYNTVIGAFSAFYATSMSNCTIIGEWPSPTAGTALSNLIAINDGNVNTFTYNVPALDWNYTATSVWSFHRTTNAQGLHVYNTFDDAHPTVNYERGIFDWNITANVLTIGTQAGGTGTIRNTAFTGGTVTFPAASIIENTSTVAGLPAAGTAGRMAFVTDATVTTFASVVAGTGTNKVPVYDDGTNWRIG